MIFQSIAAIFLVSLAALIRIDGTRTARNAALPSATSTEGLASMSIVEYRNSHSDFDVSADLEFANTEKFAPQILIPIWLMMVLGCLIFWIAAIRFGISAL
ncbi:hypothetical protein [Ochrobactrum sp. AN78]|uniref:hypothetical protein n=1 Tax=Ochrobactrum sp. AN78 TaxID=3039853 RepID=UPI00298A077F|nr:hypothetical protein [Ochrobactrum sp. AN78]MDH7790474.1 hypothetical protein [Ochrobactrum sp. AN78]